jgi:uncharacterized damage-inducible protein DinB
MTLRCARVLAALLPLAITLNIAAAPASAGEYATHFSTLGQLSIAVAHAMPAEQYSFRPHPESMNFGDLMSHIAMTNYQFCAGLKDTAPPAMTTHNNKDTIIQFLSGSFSYCAGIIPNLTEAELGKPHNSPDGRLLGREILLAMYIHVAHHRGQAEIYLRDKGIKPPQYTI